MCRYKRHRDAACTVFRIGSKQADASSYVGIAYSSVVGTRERVCKRRWGEYDNVFPVWRFLFLWRPYKSCFWTLAYWAEGSQGLSRAG